MSWSACGQKPLQYLRFFFCWLIALAVAFILPFESQAQDPTRGNKKPKIIGQQELRTVENQSIKIELTDLIVEDSDDWFYPWGFTMQLYDGDNYSVSGNTVIPKPSFFGTLTVPVTVNDGEENSEKYNLKITVEGSNDAPIITGQEPVIINEDGSFTITFNHLKVSDPDNNYPYGFSMILSPGSNYTLNDKTVTPAANYNGTVIVHLKVSDGEKTSEMFNFQITINPVNDAPSIAKSPMDTVLLKSGSSQILINEEIAVTDIDSHDMALAEVGFTADQYQPGQDILVFNNTDSIKGVFDTRLGTLTMIGKASVTAYTNALRSISITLTEPQSANKSFYYSVNDGEANSNIIVKQIKIGHREVSLDIPHGFTPNGDQVNDTWSVRLVKGPNLDNLIIRVYTKSGLLVFEGKGIESQWDGHYHGTALPSDVYYYTVSFNDSDFQSPVRGMVTILR
jgi:gliding motility-associated-like protein